MPFFVDNKSQSFGAVGLVEGRDYFVCQLPRSDDDKNAVVDAQVALTLSITPTLTLTLTPTLTPTLTLTLTGGSG